MTRTGTATAAPTHSRNQPRAGMAPTIDDRRRALRRLAEDVVNEDSWKGPGELSPVVGLIVPTLAGAAVQHPLAVFDELCCAVRELQRFDGNETDWLLQHERDTSADTAANVRDGLLGEVDVWCDRMIGRAS